ncbi:MAG: hypothetical protein GF387_00405 [Candidatus Portnoybacteria bacterium]|nr:hypothetical protein [Candidatus Portnoybacteria bacterium]
MKKILIFIIILSGILFASQAYAGIIMKPVFNTDLVGYWNLQEGAGGTAYDKSGNQNNGTLTDMTEDDWVDGMIGGALEFDGDNDYVDLGQPSNLQMGVGVITLSVWIKPTGSWDVNNIIYTNGALTGSKGYGLALDDSEGVVKYEIYGELGDRHWVNASVGVEMDKWQNLVAVFDRNEMILYVDGIEKHQMNIDDPGDVQGSYNFLIGTHANYIDDNNFHFNGKIDEVRIYNRILSAEEVKRLYNLSMPTIKAPTKTGLVGYWSFEEGRGTQAGDMSGNQNHGTLTNMTEDDWVDGKLGKALDFDGSDDYIALENLHYDTQGEINAITVCSWAKSSFLTNQIIVSFDRNEYWRLALKDDRGSNNIGWDTTDSLGTVDDLTTTADYADGNWHHICGWFNAESTPDKQIFVDGTIVASKTAHSGNNLGSGITRYGLIGTGSEASSFDGDRGPSAWMHGSIDEVRIYNRALSEDEIEALYKSGLAKINTSQNDKLTNGLVGLWSFDGPDMDGDTAYDRSSNSNHGTLINGPQLTIGKIGQGIDFDGDNDYVEILNDDSLDITNNLTIAGWIKLSSQSDLRGVFAKKDGLGWLNVDYGFVQRLSEKIEFIISDGSTYDRIWISNLNNNQWYYLVGVLTSDKLKVYLDGNYVAQTDRTVNPKTGSNLEIASPWGGGGDNFHGSIDEVRIYNRALSEEEIKRLYNMGR